MATLYKVSRDQLTSNKNSIIERGATMKKEIATLGIAKKILGLETLYSRLSDGLDFSEHSIWSIREALEAAYKLGKESQS